MLFVRTLVEIHMSLGEGILHAKGLKASKPEAGSLNPLKPKQYGGFPKLGVPGTFFWGPHNKDYSILGSILGFPHFGKVPYCNPYDFHPQPSTLGSRKSKGSGGSKPPDSLHHSRVVATSPPLMTLLVLRDPCL